MALTIAYDVTSAVKPNRGGVARYALEIVRAMLGVLGPDDRLLLGFRSSRWKHRRYAPRLDDGRVRLRPYFSLVSRWAFGGANLYHGLGVNVPVGLGDIPKAITLHAVFQDSYEPGENRGTKTQRALARTDWVILPSEFDRARAHEVLGLDPERTVAIHHGIEEERFSPVAHPDDAGLRERYGIGTRPYIVAVGAFIERKNFTGLARAYAASGARAEHDLVLCGADGDGSTAIKDEIRALGLPSIRIAGFVEPDHVPALLRGASLFACASHKESFGLPVAEAMACGAPVAYAHTHALPEVVSGAGEPFDPADDASIAAALDRVLGSEARRQELKALGLQRARHFTWERAARDHLALYGRMLGETVR